MLRQMALFHSFSWLHSSPLYIWTMSLNILSSVGEHLVSFHVLAIVNNADVKFLVHIYFFFFLRKIFIFN